MSNQPQLQATDSSAILSDRQYRLWREILENRTGIQIARERDDFVRHQICERMREQGIRDADSYFHQVLQTVAGTGEWSILLDRLLIKETRFFRHRPSFDYVQHHLTKVLAQDSHRGAVNLWSVGCASGEEAYSLAITAFESFHSLDRRPVFGVLGTDISRNALAAGRRGLFSQSRLAGVSTYEQSHYFRLLDEKQVQVTHELRNKTCFISDNLLNVSASHFNNAMDIIFCQNLLIYFKRWRRRDIANRLASCLKPGGSLVVGPGELADWVPNHLKRDSYPGVQAYIRTR